MGDEPRHICPICDGSLAPDGVKVSLETNIAVVDGRVITLGRRQAEVLYILSQRPHVFIRTDDLDYKTYGLQERGSNTSLWQIVLSLRKNLETTRWRIITADRDRSSKHSTCGGYMLTREMLADVNPELVHACSEILTEMGLEPDDTDQAVRSILSKLKT